MKRPGFFKATGWLIWKDLKSEWRSRDLVSAMLVFALITLLIFSFALELETETRSSVIAGVLWVTLAFSGTLGLNRSFSREKDQNSLDGLLLAPVDRIVLFLGKLTINWMVMLIIALIVVPVSVILFNLNLFNPQLILVIILGTLGYAETGTLLAGMTIQSRMRDLLMPVILFPVVIPLLLAAVKASSGILNGDLTGSVGYWLAMLSGYDILFGVAAWLLFDFVIKE